MKLKEKIERAVTNTVNRFSGLAQEEIDRRNVPKIITPGMPEILREIAGDGAVLLKNDNVLPFAEGTCVSLFGRIQKDYFYVGYGSGGDVNNPYAVSPLEGIRNCDRLTLNESLAQAYEKWIEENPVNDGFWGHWPLHHEEMPLDDIIVSKAAMQSDAAVVLIGRSSGEDRDCRLEKGSYYLTDDEINMLDAVTSQFDRVAVLLNTGNIIDMSWVSRYGDKIGAVMYVWQGGMESGNAIADLLCGRVNPSGKLSDTLVNDYTSIPSGNFGNKKFNEYSEDIYVGYRYFETFDKDSVLYPFGFGLSYTSFDIEHIATKPVDNGFEVRVKVTNSGSLAGKEVVQIYLKKPCAQLGNPALVLVGFAKTAELASNESEELCIFADMYNFCSYDDCGATGNAFAYVLEQGEYSLYAGNSVRNVQKVFSYYQQETAVYAQHKQAAAPQESFDIIKAEEENGRIVRKHKKTTVQKYDLGIRIMNNLPADIEQTGNLGYKLEDVKNNKVTMEQFVAQLGLDELEAITRGDYEMGSKLGADGNAGAFGGILESLRDKGIQPIITTDGPSGIRLKSSCSLLPIGTLLACSFNTGLTEKLYTLLSAEMKDRGSDVLLAPGMNIHRNPLCGRNFEYFSEDPYLTGKMAAACVKGIQKSGGSACPKHFACNNQEFLRNMNDSRLSERALREIYLKGFEICIKESKPKNIMTSYNKINGVWGHYNYDLCTTILRNEWNYKGNVMTDWWMKSEKSPEFPAIKDQAYRVRAQVDVLMPGGDRVTKRKPDGTLLASYGKPEGITLGEMQRCAINVLNAVINIKM